MGAHRKSVFVSLSLLLALGSALVAQSPLGPEGLPAPPPLPPSLEKRVPQPPPNLPDPSELRAQLRQLEELLFMPAEKLSRLRHTIEFIEKMSPDEREAMRIRLSQITQGTPEMRREIELFSSLIPSQSHSSISQFWMATSEEERKAIRSSLEGLSDEDKAPFLEAKVQAFITRRDELFAQMRESLERKRNMKLPPLPVPSP